MRKFNKLLLITIVLLSGCKINSKTDIEKIIYEESKDFSVDFEISEFETGLDENPYLLNVYNNKIYFLEQDNEGKTNIFTQEIDTKKVDIIDLPNTETINVMNYLQINEQEYIYSEIERQESIKENISVYKYNVIHAKGKERNIVASGYSFDSVYFPQFNNDKEKNIFFTTTSYEINGFNQGKIRISSYILSEGITKKWYEEYFDFKLNNQIIERDENTYYVHLEYFETTEKKGIIIKNTSRTKCVEVIYDDTNSSVKAEKEFSNSDGEIWGIYPIKDYYISNIYNKKFVEMNIKNAYWSELYLQDDNSGQKKLGKAKHIAVYVSVGDWYMLYDYNILGYSIYVPKENKIIEYKLNTIGSACRRIDENSVIYGNSKNLYIIRKKS